MGSNDCFGPWEGYDPDVMDLETSKEARLREDPVICASRMIRVENNELKQ
jgi:hypothetical protein